MSVETRHEGERLWVEINRPEALNAIDFETMDGLEAALDLAEALQPRVFVLSGAGEKAFISGGDLKRFSALINDDDAAEMARRMVAILARVEALDAWTVACVNGDAYGGGTETLLAFDIRIAAPHVRLGFTQARFHVPPGWGGLTRLVEAVGPSRAKHWLATGSVITAQEAHVAGLIHEVHDHVVAAVERRCDKLAEMEPELTRALKSGVRRALEVPHAQAIAGELEPFSKLWAGDEHHRRVASWAARK
ncbi:MAG: enoyl-CoA hydratase/isomerase family protein [bacterium]